MIANLNLDFQVSFPQGSALNNDYLAGEEKALAFYSGPFDQLESYRQQAAHLDERFGSEARERSAGYLRATHNTAQKKLEQLVQGKGLAVTTGQQPGLMGGPLYTLYKALTTLRLAEALEEALERPVLPVFWVASEDHDWAEANHVYGINLENELVRFEVSDPRVGREPSLQNIPLSVTHDSVIDEFIQSLPATDFSTPYIKSIRDAFQGNSTLPSAFTNILKEWLEPLGMVFVDAGDKSLKEASRDVLLRELDQARGSEETLAVRGAELEAAAYHTQVPLLPDAVNLFLEGERGRERLYREGERFRPHKADEALSRDEIVARVTADPGCLSPNVLLRPVVEATLIPSLAYVAGPGELAYYAQISPLYECHAVRMPVLHPRHAVTLVEPKIRKVLEKFSLSVEALHRPFHEVASEIARDEVPPEVRRALGEVRGALGKGMGELLKLIRPIDPTLKGPVTHARANALGALDEAERKIVQSLKRQNEIGLRQLEKAQQHLFPGGKPQERILNAFYYLFRYGPDFISGLRERFPVDLGTGSA